MKPEWDEAPDWANWLTMQENGVWRWHKCQPTKDTGGVGGISLYDFFEEHYPECSIVFIEKRPE